MSSTAASSTDDTSKVASGVASRTVLTAVKKWRGLKDTKVKKRLLALKEERRQREAEAKEKALLLARKIPVDVLAREWLNETKPNVETRAYLLDKLLPTLILAVEKLLSEVSKRNLEDQKGIVPDFNPLNFLAQYLMRNNPRFVHFSDSSPYMRGIRAVAEELRNSVFALEENKIAKAKAETRRKREERQKQAAMKEEEAKRRRITIAGAFRDWVQGGEVDVVEKPQVQSALQSFQRMTEFYPEETKKLTEYSKTIEDEVSHVHQLDQSMFTDYVYMFVKDFPREVFDTFAEHLVSCGQCIVADRHLAKLRAIMSAAFAKADVGEIGLLDRVQVLKLLQRFYNSSNNSTGLRDPTTWHIVENTLEQQMGEEASAGLLVKKDIKTDENVEESQQKASAKTNKNIQDLNQQLEDDKEVMVQQEGNERKEQKENLQEINEETTGDRDKSFNTTEASKANADETVEKSNEENKRLQKDEVTALGTKDVPSATNVEDKTTTTAKDQEFHSEEPTSDQKTDTADTRPAADDHLDEKVEAESNKERPQLLDEGTDKVKVETEEEIQETTANVVVDEEQERQLEKDKEQEREDIASDKPGDEFESKQADVDDKLVKNMSNDSKANEDADKQNRIESTEREDGNDGQDDVQQSDDIKHHVEVGKSGEEMIVTFHVTPVQEEDGSGRTTERTMTTSRTQRSQSRPRTRTRRIGSLVLETPIHFESSPGPVFDSTTVSKSQFLQLSLMFLGDQLTMEVARQLADFMAQHYGEDEEEREKRRCKSRSLIRQMDRQNAINQLFIKWDQNCSGYLEIDELQIVLRRWKGLDSRGAREHVRQVLDAVDNDQDQKLNRQELQAYIELLADEFPGDDDAFDEIVLFLTENVEQTYEEETRRKSRLKLLEKIRRAGKTHGVNFQPLYRATFLAIQKDAGEHGDKEVVGANVAILETAEDENEQNILNFVATTDDKDLVGRRLHRLSKKTNFAVVDSGKPMVIPKVSAHSAVLIGGPRGRVVEEVCDGSLVLVPMKNEGNRVIGVLSVDSVADPPGKEFAEHEVSYYQGVARALTSSYIYIDVRLKILRTTQSAIAWIHRRCPTVVEITVYLVEPMQHSADGEFVFRKMLTTDVRGESSINLNPPQLAKNDNLFRGYLFKCVYNSETVTSIAYGHNRVAHPLRNSGGYTLFVLDISTGRSKGLPQQQNAEMSRMLNLLTMACAEVSHEVENDEDPECVLEAESASQNVRISVLFDRLMLMELRENVEKLQPNIFSELRSYVIPPAVVHCVIQAVLTVFYPEQTKLFSDWNECKQAVSPELLKKISHLDPTASSVNINQTLILELLQDVPHGEVSKHGSRPAELLYNWLYVCLSLIEHTGRMRQNEQVSPKVSKQETTDKESPLESSDGSP